MTLCLPLVQRATKSRQPQSPRRLPANDAVERRAFSGEALGEGVAGRSDVARSAVRHDHGTLADDETAVRVLVSRGEAAPEVARTDQATDGIGARLPGFAHVIAAHCPDAEQPNRATCPSAAHGPAGTQPNPASQSESPRQNAPAAAAAAGGGARQAHAGERRRAAAGIAGQLGSFAAGSAGCPEPRTLSRLRRAVQPGLHCAARSSHGAPTSPCPIAVHVYVGRAAVVSLVEQIADVGQLLRNRHERRPVPSPRRPRRCRMCGVRSGPRAKREPCRRTRRSRTEGRPCRRRRWATRLGSHMELAARLGIHTAIDRAPPRTLPAWPRPRRCPAERSRARRRARTALRRGPARLREGADLPQRRYCAAK